MTLVEQGASRLLMAADISEGSVMYVEDTLGRKQVGYRDRILVRSPDENQAKFFGLPDDGRVPVLILLRTGYAEGPAGPAPFRLTVTVFPADRNQLVINGGEVPERLADASGV